MWEEEEGTYWAMWCAARRLSVKSSGGEVNSWVALVDSEAEAEEVDVGGELDMDGSSENLTSTP